MITLTSLSFWYNFLYFFFAVYLSFFIPGRVILGKIKVPVFDKTILALVVGIVLWAWQGFVLGYLNLRFLSYFYLLIFAVVYLRTFRFSLKTLKISKPDLLVTLIIFLGIIVQLLPVWGFGLEFSKGTYLCCANNDDFLYHAALTNSISKSFPPQEPGITGEALRNYHYWSNLVVAELVRVFRLPLFATQFQYINLLISLLLGLSALAFSRIIGVSRLFTRWLLFLLYFGGDGIFLLLLFINKNLTGLRGILSIEDGSTFLFNPPRAFSVVIAFGALSLFIVWIKNKNRLVGFVSILLFASTIGFKVYTNIFFFIGFIFLSLYFLYKRRYKELGMISLFFPITMIIYLSDNASAGGLIWAPFHFASDFIVQPALNLRNLELARQIFILHNSYLRILQYEILFLFVSSIGVFGVKIIGVFQSYNSSLRLGKELLIVIFSGIIGTYLLGSFFLQESGGANTFNFLVSSWIFLSIPAALSLDYWQRKVSKYSKFLVILFVLLIIPRVADNTYFNYVQFFKFGYLFVDKDLSSAFSFIKKDIPENSSMVVDSTFDYDRYSPFVSAFTGRKMFLSGEKILESHNIVYNKKQIIKSNIFKAEGPLVAEGLYESKADYIFLWKRDSSFYKQYEFYTNLTFKNSEVAIYRVDKNKLLELLKSRNENI